jgi:hypothetical protein
MRFAIVILCIFSAFLAPVEGQEAVPTPTPQAIVGSVAHLTPVVHLLRDDDTAEVEEQGLPIRADDELTTGQAASLCLKFDENYLELGSNTKVHVARKPSKGLREIPNLTLEGGRMRVFVTRAACPRVETQNSVIFCRGTDFIVAFDPGAGITFVSTLHGSVEVQNANQIGEPVVVQASEFTTVRGEEPPTDAKPLDQAMFLEYVNGLNFIGDGQPESLSLDNDLATGVRLPSDDGGWPITMGELPGRSAGPTTLPVHPPFALQPGELGLDF